MTFTCITCDADITPELCDVCDNDCGTFLCHVCEQEYYISVLETEDIIVPGHNPECGTYDDARDS